MVEKDAKDHGLNHLTIFKPGKVYFSEADRLGSNFMGLINPWLPKINVDLLAWGIVYHAIYTLKLKAVEPIKELNN